MLSKIFWFVISLGPRDYLIAQAKGTQVRVEQAVLCTSLGGESCSFKLSFRPRNKQLGQNASTQPSETGYGIFFLKLQVMGDSKVVIEWVQGTYRLQNLTLRTLLEQIQNATLFFEAISVNHVYRHFNAEADMSSKEVISGSSKILQMAEYAPRATEPATS